MKTKLFETSRVITSSVKFFKTKLGYKLYLVFSLAAVSAFIESFGLAALIPFLEALFSKGFNASYTGDAASEKHQEIQQIIEFVNIFGFENIELLFTTFLLLIFLLKGVFTFASSALIAHMRADLRIILKLQVYKGIVGLQYLAFTSKKIGYFSNIFNEQVDRSLSSFTSLTNLLARLAAVFIYLLTVFLIDWQFGFITLLLGVTFSLALKRLNKFIRARSREFAELAASATSNVIEVFSSLKFLKATGLNASLDAPINQTITTASNKDRSMSIAHAFTHSIREPVAIVLLAVSLFINIVFFNSLFAELFVAIVLFYRALGGFFEVQLLIQKLFETSGSLETIQKANLFFSNFEEKRGQLRPDFSRGLIRFEKVRFSYPDTKNNVFENIDLSININEIVGLVGKSGVGKSTLLDLITGLVLPSSGSLKVGGVESRDVDLTAWRSSIAYVSQSPAIFDATLLFNLTFAESFVHELEPERAQEIQKICRDCDLEDFIQAQPNGLEEKLTENGGNLSGGQAQRIAIGRAVLAKPKLLILDEFTSALDDQTEAKVCSLIEKLRNQMTIIIVSHKSKPMEVVDSVYEFFEGSIFKK